MSLFKFFPKNSSASANPADSSQTQEARKRKVEKSNVIDVVDDDENSDKNSPRRSPRKAKKQKTQPSSSSAKKKYPDKQERNKGDVNVQPALHAQSVASLPTLPLQNEKIVVTGKLRLWHLLSLISLPFRNHEKLGPTRGFATLFTGSWCKSYHRSKRKDYNVNLRSHSWKWIATWRRQQV